MKRLTAAGLILLAVAAALQLLPSGRAARAAMANVTIANLSFTDSASGTSTTTIQAGDTVTWTWNSGAVAHSTCSGPTCSIPTSPPNTTDPWGSGIFPTPHTFSHVFNTPGTYTYECEVHPAQMTGTIVVQAAPTATAVPPTATFTALPANTSTPLANASPAPTATGTPPATAAPLPTSTPAPGAAGGSVTPAAGATPSGAPGASASLPRTGDGGVAGTLPVRWLGLMLGAAGLVALAVGLIWKRRDA